MEQNNKLNNSLCHAPIPMMSDMLPQQLRVHIDVKVTSFRHHSVKVLSTTVGNSIVAIETYL